MRMSNKRLLKQGLTCKAFGRRKVGEPREKYQLLEDGTGKCIIHVAKKKKLRNCFQCK